MIYKYAYAYKTNPNYLSFYSAKSIYLKILLVNFLKYWKYFYFVEHTFPVKYK